MPQTPFALSVVLAGILLCPAAARSAPQCGERDRIVAHLAERFGETRQSIGLARNAVMELYASAQTGTWTLAVTTPDGVMCLVAAGQHFETVAQDPSARGDKV